MKPYHLNTYEQGLLGALGTGLDAGMDPMQALGIYDNTMSGAIERRQTRQATQQQGLSGLMDAAAQMAAGGADPQALQTYLAGQASSLPLMRGERGATAVGGLMSFANGLYEDGSQISGLASPELRAQYGGGGGLIDEADRGVIGQLVLTQQRAGVPFQDIRQAVQENLMVAGYEPGGPEMAEAIQLAEEQYQQITGASIGDMQNAANALRSFRANDLTTELGEGWGGMMGEVSDETNITDLLGQLAKNPEQFRALIASLQGAQGTVSDLFSSGDDFGLDLEGGASVSRDTKPFTAPWIPWG